MKSVIPLVALVGWLLAGVPATAEEPPHLEFVRGLRARRLPDYALEYLEKLRQNPPPGLAVLLPLEIAKARLDQALLELDAGKRAARQEQARAEFESFLRDHPDHPLAAEARLEMARIPVQQARAQLSRARRQEMKASQHRALIKARAQFSVAGQQLQEATCQIEAQLARYGQPQTPQGSLEKQSLIQAKLQAELAQGINWVDQAQSYVDESELLQRGALIKKAADLFSPLASRDPSSPFCAQARAWLLRCHQENGDPKAARKVYESLMEESGDHVHTAKRLGRYFFLRVIADDPLKNAATEIRQAGEAWLRDYGDAADTPEGQGVRFELAQAYLQLARRQHKQGTPPPAAQKLYEEAQKLLRGLEETENDYTNRAREQRLSIVLAVAEERTRGDIARFKDFEECFLRAQVEAARLSQADKEGSGSKQAGQRRKHVEDMIAALQRALDLADSHVSMADRIHVQYLLAKAYGLAGEPYHAAVLGEEVARRHKHSWPAPLAAACALFAYAQILAAEQRVGSATEDASVDRSRLRNLAEYVEQTWPDDPAADLARHQRGLLLWGEKNYALAVDVLARINGDYADATHALYLLALAANKAEEAGVKPPAGQPAYSLRALEALEAIPEPIAGTDPATLQAYLEAKLTLGGLLYRAQQHSRVKALTAALHKVLATAEGMVDDKNLKEQRPRVLALALLADYSLADEDCRAGRYGEAGKRLDPILARLKDPKESASLAEMKDPRLLHALLALALRAHVQQGDLKRGREILELLQQSAPEDSLEMLLPLVQQLRTQVQDLRRQGPSGKSRLDQTIANFSMFLDELGKRQDKLAKPQTILFLAQSYSSLEKHGRAIELLERIAEPPAGAAPEDVQGYRAARLLYVRELRLDRRFEKAKEVLQSLLGTRERPGWGQSNPEAQKERIYLLQDQELYSGRGGAIYAWNDLMAQLRPKIGQDNKLKEQYFECYYHLTACVFKNALKMSDPQKKREALHMAANLVVQLEAAQPDMGGELSKKLFEELLQKEPVLKEKYEELKKGSR